MNELTLKKHIVNKCILCLILAICHKLNPPRLRKLSKMIAGLRQCMMNCFSFKGMMSKPWCLDRKVSTSLAQSGYSTIRLMKREM